MSARSAALLVWRRRKGRPEFLLAHPGGPYWRGKDQGAWSIPKGLIEEGEDGLRAARREFEEEVGVSVDGAFEPLAPCRQKSGKLILAWMIEADPELAAARSGEFEMEWPPRSGITRSFPEVDKVAWSGLDEGLTKIHPGQRPILLEAAERIGRASAQADALALSGRREPIGEALTSGSWRGRGDSRRGERLGLASRQRLH
ncbi:MAG: NUDIX domain-containing protein [Caulobacteraceae bacterium]